jgi:hypothetical protein
MPELNVFCLRIVAEQNGALNRLQLDLRIKIQLHQALKTHRIDVYSRKHVFKDCLDQFQMPFLRASKAIHNNER